MLTRLWLRPSLGRSIDTEHGKQVTPQTFECSRLSCLTAITNICPSNTAFNLVIQALINHVSADLQASHETPGCPTKLVRSHAHRVLERFGRNTRAFDLKKSEPNPADFSVLFPHWNEKST